jgi:hypothetical protein
MISLSECLCLNTLQHKHRINAHRDIHALSVIRTHDPSVRASEDSSCLRLRGYCDRQLICLYYINIWRSTWKLLRFCNTSNQWKNQYIYSIYCIQHNCVWGQNLKTTSSHQNKKNVHINMCLETFNLWTTTERSDLWQVLKLFSMGFNARLDTSHHGPPHPFKVAGAVADSLTGIRSAVMECLSLASRSCIRKGF